MFPGPLSTLLCCLFSHFLVRSLHSGVVRGLSNVGGTFTPFLIGFLRIYVASTRRFCQSVAGMFLRPFYNDNRRVCVYVYRGFFLVANERAWGLC